MNSPRPDPRPGPDAPPGGVRRLYLDLDGVMADFDAFVRAQLGCRPPSPLPGWAWRRLSAIPALYRQLQPLDGAKALFRELVAASLPLAILTATPLPTACLATAADDKREWVRRHLCPRVPVITVSGGEAKALFAAPGALLIDDSERNLRAWQARGGLGLHHRSHRATRERLAALGILH
ncbi:MAG: hypothetical protein KA603_02665 [Azonexus sp.]|nr:hypothetical protein [Betaproteobacteria bacterium]MBK8917257.1 hypothetical protein [Betaproteobacteria bacterium]MBP6035020.1 hypothetical protein [Azonexus sp.]MBP6906002.1 hypothetical protein [Azonexus sp.]